MDVALIDIDIGIVVEYPGADAEIDVANISRRCLSQPASTHYSKSLISVSPVVQYDLSMTMLSRGIKGKERSVSAWRRTSNPFWVNCCSAR